MLSLRSCTLLTLTFFAAAVSLAADRLSITPDHPSGEYKSGETVTWKIELTGDSIPADAKIAYEIRPGGLKKSEPVELPLKDGKAEVTVKHDKPGTLLLVASYKPAKDKQPLSALGGAVFDATAIKPSAPAPEDFDAFWKEKVAELHAVEMDLKMTPVETGNPKIDYYHFTLSNIRGKKIHGQLAKPKGGTNLPAMLQVQWAGVYALDRSWITGYAELGWLAVNIQAHDLPIDEKPEFYQAKAKGELEDYPGQGNDDRETSYFLPMFLSCRRAVDFITEHQDWNKKVLVVHGMSQGGYQAIITAGLPPAVTAIAANVPAGCDHTGKLADREPGWPNWASRTWKGRDEKKMLEAARYFDAMNFAPRVKCPALVGLGLIDSACPPEGVIATCNALGGDKQIIIMPLSDHGGDHRPYQEQFAPFLAKQREREE